MAQASGSAQLITAFDPVAAPAVPTTVDQAISQWSRLPEASQAEALLLIYESESQRPRILGRSAIVQLAGSRPARD
ncbi:hypothetical protein M9980_07505 [Sphingomonas donggukensis]|uniref:Uncharacterized protein n=1 Tax=Sphingomonas donggukensis TaxID=2949093 RepID=A0ABY4TQ54_9SPHN|nr:hypothetical protein [Sphingomonas donggukensis]URW74433.1 hypothetical protein M9980_07505 [Sphingomonas donggukensis]